jgi:HEAT repeat protein
VKEPYVRYCVESECERARVPSHARTHALRMYGGHIERARLMVSGVFLTALLVIFAGCSGNEDVPSLISRASEGDNRAAMKLVEAMGSPDKDLALAAYSGVIDLGIDFQPWLIKGLESPNDSVVEASAAALGNLGDSGSLPALIRILEGDEARRYAAAWALGEIGDLTAVPNLVPILGSKDMLLRKSAVRALVKMGPEAGAAVTTFLSAAKNAGSERAAIRVVGELKTVMAVDRLISIDGPNRDAAAWALGRIGGQRALEPLLDALSDPRWQVRREAAQALGSLEDDKSVPALTGALEDPVTVVREWAARSLETITGRKVLYLGEDGDMVPPYNLYR